MEIQEPTTAHPRCSGFGMLVLHRLVQEGLHSPLVSNHVLDSCRTDATQLLEADGDDLVGWPIRRERAQKQAIVWDPDAFEEI
jgi:hypothetical protein